MSHFDSSFLSKVSNGCRNHLVTWILVFGCSEFGVVASYLPKWSRSMSSFAVELLPKWDKYRRFLDFDTPHIEDQPKKTVFTCSNGGSACRAQVSSDQDVTYVTEMR